MLSGRSLVLAVCVGAASLFATSLARAEAPDVATAQALFDDAKKLVAAGKYADACPKFLASHRLDPKVGTLLNLADCHEKIGQTASAWARFLESKTMAERAGQTEREKFASDRAAALAKVLSKLAVTLSTQAKETPGLEVKRDGVLLDAAAYGTSVPIDPGPHVIDASAPGRKSWSTNVEIGPDGAHQSVEVPALAVEWKDAEPSAARRGVADAKPGHSTQRNFAIGAGAIGVIGIGVGSVFGLLAMSKWSDAKAGCDPAGCAAPSVEAGQSASTLANVSTIGFIVGAVGLAGGAVLWFTAPKSPPRPVASGWQWTPAVLRSSAPNGGPVAGVAFRGAFQ